MKHIFKKLKKGIKSFLPTRTIVTATPLEKNLRILSNEYLQQVGWNHSVENKMPIDKDDHPLPWFTYSAISFIGPRLKNTFAVFEYGSGNSTRWFSRQVARVVSVEHDPEWFAKMAPQFEKIQNVTYYQKPLEQHEYGKFVSEFDAEFDVVVIDGQDRVTCAKNVLGALKPEGIIIWDNSDRTEYQEGYKFLIENGFKRIDFNGLGPINHYGWGTSIFYRTANVFDL
ncbi:MAG: class I SAM-dependent methyltransferase [Dokdonia sp.]|jgi:hypothetical protein